MYPTSSFDFGLRLMVFKVAKLYPGQSVPKADFV